MRVTTVFKSGNSLAVRLPKDFHVSGGKVEIFRRNHDVVIREIPKTLARAFELFTQMPEDFFAEGRQDALPQEREF
jgi:antitoxin VapB